MFSRNSRLVTETDDVREEEYIWACFSRHERSELCRTCVRARRVGLCSSAKRENYTMASCLKKSENARLISSNS